MPEIDLKNNPDKRRGRRPTTAETALTRQEELYVQAIIAGATKRQAFRAADYRIPDSWSPQQVSNKARFLESRVNVRARLIALGYKKTETGWSPPPPPIPPPGVDTFDPANITPAWVNAQANFVLHQALSNSEYASALRTLDFIARFNNFTPAPRKAGRPPVHAMPNHGDVSGNYRDENPEPKREDDTPELDTLFGDSGDGDGDGDTPGDEPFFRSPAARQTSPGTVQRERADSAAGGNAGVARKVREKVSGKVAGE